MTIHTDFVQDSSNPIYNNIADLEIRSFNASLPISYDYINTCTQQQQQERQQPEPIHSSVGCPIDITMMDDTALINAIPVVSKSVSVVSKSENHVNMSGCKQEYRKKNEKGAPQRSSSNGLTMKDSDSSNKKTCSREVLKALRFVGVDENAKKDSDSSNKKTCSREVLKALRFVGVDENAKKDSDSSNKKTCSREVLKALRFVGVDENAKKDSDSSNKKMCSREVLEALRFVSVDENAKKDSDSINKKTYSREVLETLRYANVDEQDELWYDIYNGFNNAVAKDYDDLQTPFSVKFDQNYNASSSTRSAATRGRGKKW